MKRFSLLALLSLVAFVFAIACTDATSPNSPRLAPKSADLGFRGEAPPPPADVAINITVSSVTFSGPFNGVYFTNGATPVAGAFNGNAWLKLDNKQPGAFLTSASSNVQFKRHDERLSGKGTIVIAGHVVEITEVTSFFPNESCSVTGEVCAFITFNATVDGESGHTGSAQAFNREACEFIDPGEGPPYYSCGD